MNCGRAPRMVIILNRFICLSTSYVPKWYKRDSKKNNGDTYAYDSLRELVFDELNTARIIEQDTNSIRIGIDTL